MNILINHVPDTVLGPGDIEVNETDKIPCLHRILALVG